jgi:hypothetical protein
MSAVPPYSSDPTTQLATSPPTQLPTSPPSQPPPVSEPTAPALDVAPSEGISSSLSQVVLPPSVNAVA